MRSSQRSLIAFLAVGIVVAALAGLLGNARLAAESSVAAVAGDPLILSGQKPRLQDFFAGGNADFTVAITNTGAVALQNVTVTGATVAACNRNNLGPLTPGQSTSYSCSRTNVTESFLNELQVNGITAAKTVSHRSNAFVKVLKPELRITKEPESQTVRSGATAFFTITLYNPSDFIMTVEGVDDPLVEDCELNPTITINLPPKESLDYICTQPNVQESMATIATARTTNPINSNQYTASDVAWVEVLDLEASLTPEPGSIPEPGDHVTYTVSLTNTGSVPVTLMGLTTNQYGNILDPSNLQVEAAHNTCLPQPSLPTLQPFGGNYSCTFTALAGGQPSNFSVLLTATAKDKNDLDITATTSATVVITNVPASMALTLGADPSFINPPSRLVTFSVRVENTSPVDNITITAMNDEFLGDLNGRGTCELPVEGLAPGFSYQCRFSATISGVVGQQKSRTIFVTAVDDDLSPEMLNENDIVTVGITDRPAQAIFMPNITDDSVEPNNNCFRAYPLSRNRQYFFRPPNKYNSLVPLDQRDQDYFSFELIQSGRVTIEMTNFVPRSGQLIIRPHVEGGNPPCGTPPLARNPDEALDRSIDLGTRPAGRYYIQIINDGPSNVQDLYGLIVRVN